MDTICWHNPDLEELIDRGRLSEARQRCEELLANPPEPELSADKIVTLHYLARVHYECWDFDVSIGLLQEVIARLQARSDADPCILIGFRNDIARKHIDASRASIAEVMLGEVFAEIARNNWTHQTFHAVALSNLGFVRTQQGRLQDAEKTFSQAALLRSQIWGRRHFRSAFGAMHLARLSLMQGKLSRAWRQASRAQTILDAWQMNQHIDYAWLLRLAGDICKRSGKEKDAVALYQCALAIAQKVRGEVPLIVQRFESRLEA